MGSRANYVVIENGDSELWYSHWTAQTLTQDLFWGPEAALSFIRRQQRTEEWLDDVWCEGAALIDFGKKTLLLFGGEDLKYEPALRRVYLALLAGPWSGWEIRWAHEGLVDLAEYVGLDRTNVLSGKDGNEGGTPGLAAEWTESVTSVVWEDGRFGLYPMNCKAAYQVTHGSDLLDILRMSAKPPEQLASRELGGGGLHLDVKEKRLDFWTASPEPDIGRRAAQRWPGWSVVWHRDRFEAQAALTSNRLAFEIPSDDELLGRVVEILEYEPRNKDRAEELTEIAAILSAHEKKPVTIHPNALIDAAQDVSADVRKEILCAAQASFRERRAQRAVVTPDDS